VFLPAPEDQSALWAVTQALCGEEIVALWPADGGANSRVYCVETACRRYALKCYPPSSVPSGGERLAREFAALKFLHGQGCAEVPAALASDRNSGVALYEWIEGAPPATHDSGDIDAAVALVGKLYALRFHSEASNMLAAWEAFTSTEALVEHLRCRVERLMRSAAAETALTTFLRGEFEPELNRRAAGPRGLAVAASRTLSPSDFSLHNALRRADGRIVFIDFEYFGWDDPVKLSSDFLWHPGHHLSPEERDRFFAGVQELFGEDPEFADRFAVAYPLFGLKWALIVLNEFMPEAWERRRFSGKRGSWKAAKERQLDKAAALLASVKELR
jgi:hypothetical protein